MQSIGIGDLQKNTAIFTNLTESLEIVDKRRKRTVAIVYPVTKTSIISRLSGKYQKQVSAIPSLTTDELNKAKEQAMLDAMDEKYGFTD